MKTLFGEQIETLNSDRIFYHLENGEYNSLSDVELIYSIVGNEELAARIFMSAGKDYSALFRYSIAELMKIPGIGKKKAMSLVAAMEMGRRRIMNYKEDKKKMLCSKDLYEYFSPQMRDLEWEEMWMVTLNSCNVITSKYMIGKGGRSSVVCDISMLLKKAIEKNAIAIAVFHNHPSGNPKPSSQDNMLTRRIYEAANILDIKLIDHIIIGSSSYYSFADEGKI